MEQDTPSHNVSSMKAWPEASQAKIYIGSDLAFTPEKPAQDEASGKSTPAVETPKSYKIADSHSSFSGVIDNRDPIDDLYKDRDFDNMKPVLKNKAEKAIKPIRDFKFMQVFDKEFEDLKVTDREAEKVKND